MMERNKFTAEQEKWLQALESGEYRQCGGMLHNGSGGHCCLGVADVVCNLGEGQVAKLWTSFRRLGLRDHNGSFARRHEVEGGTTSLVKANDAGGWNFARIAAFIRANPWQVFTNFDPPSHGSTLEGE